MVNIGGTRRNEAPAGLGGAPALHGPAQRPDRPPPRRVALQFFDGGFVVGEDADVPGDAHGFFDDAAGGEVGVGHEGAGGGLGEGASGADRGDAFVGFDDVSGAGDEVGLFVVGDDQEGFEVAEHLVGAPVFGKFDGGAAELSVELLELGFEAGEEVEGVGGGAGESGEDLVLVEAADLLGVVLDDGFAHGDLSVGSHDDFAVAADAEDGGGADAGSSHRSPISPQRDKGEGQVKYKGFRRWGRSHEFNSK